MMIMRKALDEHKPKAQNKTKVPKEIIPVRKGKGGARHVHWIVQFNFLSNCLHPPFP